ncbi:MAG: hypothetical protein ACOWWR_07760, partial [Eubacteriales bacterium]
ITSLSGVSLVILTSIFFNSIRIINYLGKNSLVILGVHFPFIERMNIVFSDTAMYNTIEGKLIGGILIYSFTVLISLPFIYYSKKIVPRFTGYQDCLVKLQEVIQSPKL